MVGRLFAAFLLAAFACGASLILLLGLNQGSSSASYGLVFGVVLLIVIGAAGLAMSWRWLRRLVAPIDDLLAATEQLADGQYQARVPIQGIPELRSLGRAINAMATRLESSAARRRGFFASVAHELRTPLTILRGDLEGMLDDVTPRSDDRIRSLLEETHHLSNLVEDLRTLSLAEAGTLDLRRESLDLADFVIEVVSSFQSEAGRAGVQLDTASVGEGPSVAVDPLRLREVLANLIVNAIQAVGKGGRVRLSYEFYDESHRISVSDDGPGIPQDKLEAVFDRFSKLPGSTGSGLGLAIARELIEAHGGSLQAASERGSGTTMTIHLPRITGMQGTPNRDPSR